MLFEPASRPRLFGLPPGADFPARLVEGIFDRLGPGAPERLAKITLYLNSQRMRRRVREMFLARGATFLPRLRLVSELGSDPLLTNRRAGQPTASALGRRLELAVLIDRLLQAQPELAPRHALYDLADSLAALMDEMRAENVPPGTLASLDVEGHAAHWARTRRFVALVEQFFGEDAPPDAEARLREAVLAQVAGWELVPTPDPVIVAGSTGSRGTTAVLMRAVAALPQGALLVPGYDFDQPDAVWQVMDDGPAGQEDHPQYRYHRLMRDLALVPAEVMAWDDKAREDDARNRLVSLALRPAPVTDQWIAEGPGLGDLTLATAKMALIEADSPRAEAQAIALCLRRAVAEGRRAALISPDRDLTRRVTAALDRWQLEPDDSAGEPLIHAAPGRLLRLVARGMGKRLAVDECLTLLKHPLSVSTEARGPHLRLSRELELYLRRKGPAYPDMLALTTWAAGLRDPFAPIWAAWLGAWLEALAQVAPGNLSDLIARHRQLAEDLARGMDQGSGALWTREAGEAALQAIYGLAEEAPADFNLSLSDYGALFDGILSRGQVRRVRASDERVVILGAQEARVQGADLVVLAGLTEGVWPAQPDPDPWLNRKMRLDAGLLLPERRIGLAAHDFQMAVAAPEVVLSHARRNAEAETVPSRWLNRLVNLLDGLPETGGKQALAAMRARGDQLIAQAMAVEAPLVTLPARRPSPRPPVALRPQQLSLTEVEVLIRDPYAIYAKHVLKLHPLSPARPMADARLRGEVLHKVPEAFLREGVPDTVVAASAALMRITDRVLEKDVAWPVMRTIWRARMEDLARPFVEGVFAAGGRAVSMEKKYAVDIPGLDFKLIGKPDRIDLTEAGRARIIDYKTGMPPSLDQQKIFAKQLHLAAVMASLGAFPEIGPQSEVEIAYVQLKRDLKTVASVLGSDELAQVLDEFRKLIMAYREPGRGYTARRAVFETRSGGDYDDLARYGEWDLTDPAVPEDVP